MTERITLITGASSGIGAELARIFASEGRRLVLVARRADRLNALAAEIVSKGGANPVILICDLRERDCGETIARELAAQDLSVEILVNNAGFGLMGEARKLPRQDQIDLVDVNVRAMTDLTLRFCDSIIAARGAILNVASIAAYLSGPRMATYYASKAFVLSFSEALHTELAPHGVRVTALCPGPVPTEFQSVAGMKDGLDSKLLNVSARDVALAGYRGLMSGRRVVLPGMAIKLIPFLLRFAPKSLVLAVTNKVQTQR